MFRLNGDEIMAVGLNLKEPYRQDQKVYNLDYFVAMLNMFYEYGVDQAEKYSQYFGVIHKNIVPE